LQFCLNLRPEFCHSDLQIAVVVWLIVTWTRINEEVDALVHYRKDLNLPLLKSINYGGKRRSFVGSPVVEADEHSLYFDVRDRSTRYALRFDRDRQRWTLEGMDDSGVLGPRDLPRWRYFPVPD
jgi:hypothetical protein